MPLREFLLLSTGVKNRRAVLAADIRPLAIQLGGIVRHAEEHFQQLPIGNLRRIEADAHRFRMPGRSCTHHLVIRGCRAAAGIARYHTRHTLDVFEHRVHTPETTPGEHRRLFGCFRRCG